MLVMEQSYVRAGFKSNGPHSPSLAEACRWTTTGHPIVART